MENEIAAQGNQSNDQFLGPDQSSKYQVDENSSRPQVHSFDSSSTDEENHTSTDWVQRCHRLVSERRQLEDSSVASSNHEELHFVNADRETEALTAQHNGDIKAVDASSNRGSFSKSRRQSSSSLVGITEGQPENSQHEVDKVVQLSRRDSGPENPSQEGSEDTIPMVQQRKPGNRWKSVPVPANPKLNENAEHCAADRGDLLGGTSLPPPPLQTHARQPIRDIDLDDDEGTLETDNYTDVATGPPRSPETGSLESMSQPGHITEMQRRESDSHTISNLETEVESRWVSRRSSQTNEMTRPPLPHNGLSKTVHQEQQRVAHIQERNVSPIADPITEDQRKQNGPSVECSLLEEEAQENQRTGISIIDQLTESSRARSPTKIPRLNGIHEAGSPSRHVTVPSRRNSAETGKAPRSRSGSRANSLHVKDGMTDCHSPERSTVSAFSRSTLTRSPAKGKTLGNFQAANKSKFKHVSAKVDNSLPLGHQVSVRSMEIFVQAEGCSPVAVKIDTLSCCYELYRRVADRLGVAEYTFVLHIRGTAITAAKSSSVQIFGISHGAILEVIMKKGFSLPKEGAPTQSLYRQSDTMDDLMHGDSDTMIEWDELDGVQPARNRLPSPMRRKSLLSDVPELALLKKLGLDDEGETGNEKDEDLELTTKLYSVEATVEQGMEKDKNSDEFRRIALLRLHIHVMNESSKSGQAKFQAALLQKAWYKWSSKVWHEASKKLQKKVKSLEDLTSSQEGMIQTSQSALKNMLLEQTESDKELSTWVFKCVNTCKEQMSLLNSLRLEVCGSPEEEGDSSQQFGNKKPPQTKKQEKSSRCSRSIEVSSKSSKESKNKAHEGKKKSKANGYVDLLKSTMTPQLQEAQDSNENHQQNSVLTKINDLISITQTLASLHQDCMEVFGIQGMSGQNNQKCYMEPDTVGQKIDLEHNTEDSGRSISLSPDPTKTPEIPRITLTTSHVKELSTFYQPNLNAVSSVASPSSSNHSRQSSRSSSKRRPGRELILKPDSDVSFSRINQRSHSVPGVRSRTSQRSRSPDVRQRINCKLFTNNGQSLENPFPNDPYFFKKRTAV